jgi:predicted RNA-binding Zn-ribbon protein involved in translation (DUF1610 family)
MRSSPSDRLIRSIIPLRVVFGRRPTGIPLGFWRQYVDGQSRDHWVFGVSVATILFNLAVMISIAGLLVFRRYVYWPGYALSMFVSMASLFVFTRMRRRIKRDFVKRLVESDACVCLECGYSLLGSATSHVCPECGVEFDLAATIRRWHSVFPELNDQDSIAPDASLPNGRS